MNAPTRRWGLAPDDHILVVEDNDGDADLVELMLTEAFGPEVNVSRAHTRAAALAFLADRGAACVLLDLGLPDADGVETVRRLAAWAPSAAIVVLTGDDNAETGMAAVQAGAQDYLVKGRSSTADTVGRAVQYALVRKRAEQSLAQATSRLAAIVESSADAIIGKKLDGVITSWNAGAEQMYGYTADDIVGRNISQLIPQDRADELMAILDGVRQGDRIVDLETTRRCKNGTILDVSISVSPIRDANGAVTGAATVSRDMTARNHAEADRRALEDRLRQSERLESLGHLAGGIAHDFNNLLAAIINYAAFVAQETTDMPSVRADVEQIQAAAARAARLTKQLLIFARSDTMRLETLNLNVIVADIHNLLSRSLGPHLELAIRPAANLPTIRADRGQIEQVLLNLAVNARDAMHDGGTLTIETRPAELDEGYANLHPDASPGHYVELDVSDTGTGMSPEVVDHIFEPFFTTKPTGHGTGLGLATVYGIVAETGGTMSVYSEQGIGTTFRLYFPATDSPVPAADSTTTSRRGNEETILVVDDEPAVLEVTARILRQNGYIALEAATFEEALTLAAGHDFQLLLTDLVMPHMSGRALADRVEELRPGRPVVFMSGYSDGILSTGRILEAGVGLIQKPFNRRALLEAMHTALS